MSLLHAISIVLPAPMGLAVIAQAVLDEIPSAERIIGGSILIAASGWAVRVVFKLLEVARQAAEDARQVLDEERHAWREERAELNELIRELRREKQIRASTWTPPEAVRGTED
jgi:hypothetical protein